MRFSESVVLVAGGAHGIGRATVERFLSEGARVALLDADAEGAEETARELEAGEHLALFDCDIKDAASVDQAVAAATARFGRLDVLASVAGGDYLTDDPLDEAHWDDILDWNLQGPVRLVRACIPHLTPTQGSIVIVGSVNGLVAYSEPAYSSAKAGLSLLARNLAVELGPSGVRINIVAPGTVRTRVWDTQGGADGRRAFHPLGRIGEPADIAAAIAFLASDDASWITGVTLPVDGGSIAGPLIMLRQTEQTS